jgi:cytochrome c-type biogenesis protein CcmH
MTLWLAFALMTAAAIFAVLWPLSRPARLRGGSDVAVYRDQLDEIVRDQAAGLIAEGEAHAAKVEVSRRLLAAGDAEQAQPPASPAAALRRRRVAAVAALLVPPLLGAGIYLLHGSPDIAGEPLASRPRAIAESRSIDSLIAQAEAHLEQDPNDGRGWDVLAPVYLRLGRADDAVKARRNALRLNGETASRQADLGEALVAAANGVVTVEAKVAFERALALGPNEVKSRFYSAVAAEQDGARDKAVEIWRRMLRDAPSDAPWVAAVREALARNNAAAPAPSAADVAAAATMTESDRSAMVTGMVARLSDRLKQDGSDVEGWLRLVRAYMVLGERDKASAAAGDARRALAGSPEKIRRIDDLAKGLGLEG